MRAKQFEEEQAELERQMEEHTGSLSWSLCRSQAFTNAQ